MGRFLKEKARKFPKAAACQKNIEKLIKNRENPLDIKGIFFYDM
jgi:hypothetical protein